MSRLRQQNQERSFGFTSMIDVVFLLLLFFILQPFKSLEMRLDNRLSSIGQPSKEPVPMRTIHLRVVHDPADSAGALYILDGKRLGADHRLLAEAVRRACNGDLLLPVCINSEAGVRFVHVVRALDQCRVAGMRQVALAAPAGARSRRGKG